MTTQKWTDERTQLLTSTIGSESPVTKATVEHAASVLGNSTRSIAAKLRKLGYDVASLAQEAHAKFSHEETAELVEFLNENSGAYTYAEIASLFKDGEFSTKAIQGKILSLEMTGMVKPTEKVVAQRTYTPEEEATFITMAKSGAFIEDIAQALGKEVDSVRGKALSLLRNNEISKIPVQKNHKVEDSDPLVALEDRIAGMTIPEIAVAIGKTERGVKTMLTRRGIKVADYDGAAKKAKNEEKAAA